MGRLTIISLLFLFTLVPVARSQNSRGKQKIPNDLEIRVIHGSTTRFGTNYTYTINSEGFVTVEYRSRGLPTGRSVEQPFRLPGQPEPPKPPKKKKRLTRAELTDLLEAFESSGFFAMRERYWGDPNAVSQTCINHAEEKGLSILTKGIKKETSFYLGCSYETVPEFKKFNELFDTISAALNGVRITETRPEGN
jgi:hypothetical protein